MDLELLQQTRQEYKLNKVRKQERWFDWTAPPGDALDELAGATHVRARRSADPIPYDVFELDDGKARSTTPYNKRNEMEKSPEAAKEMFAATSAQAEVMAKRKYRPTSIFGGQQQVPGRAGEGWQNSFGYAPPEPAEAGRNRRTMAKYATSSFPSKYDDFQAKEYSRMNKRALGL